MPQDSRYKRGGFRDSRWSGYNKSNRRYFSGRWKKIQHQSSTSENSPLDQEIQREKMKTASILRNRLLSLSDEYRTNSMRTLIDEAMPTSSSKAVPKDTDMKTCAKRIAHVPKPIKPHQPPPVPRPLMGLELEYDVSREMLPQNEIMGKLLHDLMSKSPEDLKRLACNPKANDEILCYNITKVHRSQMSEAMRKLAEHKLQWQEGDKPKILAELEQLFEPDMALDMLGMSLETVQCFQQILNLQFDETSPPPEPIKTEPESLDWLENVDDYLLYDQSSAFNTYNAMERKPPPTPNELLSSNDVNNLPLMKNVSEVLGLLNSSSNSNHKSLPVNANGMTLKESYSKKRTKNLRKKKVNSWTQTYSRRTQDRSTQSEAISQASRATSTENQVPQEVATQTVKNISVCDSVANNTLEATELVETDTDTEAMEVVNNFLQKFPRDNQGCVVESSQGNTPPENLLLDCYKFLNAINSSSSHIATRVLIPTAVNCISSVISKFTNQLEGLESNFKTIYTSSSNNHDLNTVKQRTKAYLTNSFKGKRKRANSEEVAHALPTNASETIKKTCQTLEKTSETSPINISAYKEKFKLRDCYVNCNRNSRATAYQRKKSPRDKTSFILGSYQRSDSSTEIDGVRLNEQKSPTGGQSS